MSENYKIIDRVLSKLSIEPKISVISGTRPETYGIDPKSDYFIEESLDLTEKVKNKFSIKSSV